MIKLKQFKIGFEIEHYINYDLCSEYENAIADSSLPIQLGSDSSISGDGEGYELRASRGLSYTTYKDTIKKTSEVLGQFNAEVNSTCGFHVHISNKRFFNNGNIKKIIFFWSAIEDVLIATQPRSRLNGQYCQRYLMQYVMDERNSVKLPKAKDELINKLATVHRYKTLNLSSLQRHGTIEVRLHAGTTNAEKILAWTDLLLAIFTYCLERYDHDEVAELFRMKISEDKIAKVLDLLQLSNKNKNFFQKRVVKFMFNILAMQQEEAGKLVDNMKAIRKAQKAYDRAQKKYNEVDEAFQQSYRVLATNH